MKRDIELIHRILLMVEEDETGEGVEVDFWDVPSSDLIRHVSLLESSGYIVVDHGDSWMNLSRTAPRIVRMTMQGHDYLDSIRNRYS